MRRKTIEYENPIMRSDNKRIAKCGRFTKTHCYRYRFTDDRCIGCTMMPKRGRKANNFTINGIVYAKCTHCGKIKTISHFYINKRTAINRKGEISFYYVYNYRCKKCTYKWSLIYQKRKHES